MIYPVSRRSRSIAIGCLCSLLAAIPVAHATNGMNIEGYGPIATAMGGTSLAFDNGTAAVINNPATLSLQSTARRFDLAVGLLGPDVKATTPTGQSAVSEATLFAMPAVGYTIKSGAFAYGLALFGQGGMGCQYGPDTWRGLGFGLPNRTEVSIGRFIAPLAWKVNERLTLAATVDFVWAGMDLRMAMSGAQFNDMVNPQSQRGGRASGRIVQSFGQMLQGMPAGTAVDYAYFDFSNTDPMTGSAKGYGYAGKVGLLYEVSRELSVGFTYHSETSLSDLDAVDAHLAFQLNVPGMGRMPQRLVGDIRVRDFEWPALAALGVAWRPDPRWLVALDLRQIYWSNVMQQFAMGFQAIAHSSNGPFVGQDLDAVLFQHWKDQTVVMLGASYRANDRFTLRFGGNFGNNPIPSQYLNCLFPATTTTHLTAGMGWKVTPRSSVDISVTRGLSESVKNGADITVKHSQLNAQLMYSVGF